MATLEQLTELDMLNECALECTKQSRWKETTQRYIADMLSKNIELRNDVLSGNYSVKPTIDFSINERGHIRKIEAPVVRDRVLQKSMMKNVLTPNIRPYLIYDNYASLKLRGTSFARKRFEIMLRRYMAHNGKDGYILLFDFKSFFELVDHDVLKQLLVPRLKNEPDDVVALIHYMIDTSSKTDKGLNLGGEPPQIFAVYYPTLIDIFVKVVLGIKYYGRYMDDGFVIAKTNEELVDILCKIEEKLSELKLIINRKKTHIVKLKHGFTFLQIKYNITPTGKILKRPTHSKITRERRRLKAFKRMYDNGKMTIEEIVNCYKSWRGTFVKEHNAYRKTLASMDALFKSLFPVEIIKTQRSRNALVKQAYLKFPNNEWAVIVVFDFDVDLEYEELQEQLRSFGMKPYNIKKALNILSSYNTGMAISNDVLKMSAIYISDTTSPSQFWDSCAHELAHVVTAIIDAYDVPYYSEDAAYLSGFLMRQLVEEIGEPCRQ